MMKPTLLLQDEEDEIMHIELQATDSSGSSKEDEEDYADVEGHHPQTNMAQSELIKDISIQQQQQQQEFLCRPSLDFLLNYLTFRRVVSLLLGVAPVCIFALEMIPERCHVCLDGVELDTYFFAAAVCGGLAAILFGSSTYVLARLLGGAISALGALFLIWLVLTTIPSNMAFLFVFVGILGAMPGVGAYFVIRILSDLCYFSDIDDFDEIAPLTKLITISSAD
jgi:hypothetical protein